ncbi:MAG: 5-formyltetrahydrofolate cyclo-ligase [Geitlerinemataceae cyanobacterium]
MPLSDDLANRKRQLRRQFLKQRQAIGPADWRARSNRLCENVRALPVFQTARSLLAFVSFRCEPDLSPLYDRADTTTERCWGFPRCQGRSLIWHQRRRGTAWVCGSYGINEPGADWPPVDLTTVDIVLVPAVAVDRSGGRLGYGGGFYDRCLERSELKDAMTIGVVFEESYCDALPRDPWDVPLDYVCTEASVDRIAS